MNAPTAVRRHRVTDGHGSRWLSYPAAFPLAPVVVALGLGRLGPADPRGVRPLVLHDGAKLALSRLAHQSGQTIDLWLEHGLSSVDADRLACRLNMHAHDLWGPAWFNRQNHQILGP